MIKTKDDLKYYLQCDKVALGINKKHPSFLHDAIWKFEILYRKTEYHFNNRDSIFHRLAYMIYYFRFRRQCIKRCSEFPLNVFEEGLVIWHGYNIIINGNARVGRNFSISANCCIGQAHNEYPTIGNNVEMSLGSIIIGGIKVADDVTIGAGAVVTKSIDESFTTWGGVPAKLISRKQNNYVTEKKKRLATTIKQMK